MFRTWSIWLFFRILCSTPRSILTKISIRFWFWNIRSRFAIIHRWKFFRIKLFIISILSLESRYYLLFSISNLRIFFFFASFPKTLCIISVNNTIKNSLNNNKNIIGLLKNPQRNIHASKMGCLNFPTYIL
jgi:hypothetical protein